MPWHNKVAAIDDRFADATPEGWRGEIWLRPTELQSFYGTTVHEAVIGMAIEQRSRILSLVSPDQNDDPLKLDLAVRQAGDNYDVESTGQIALPLAPIMADANDERLADGKIIFDGEMKGQGRSPMAALSGATGKGNYRLAGASFTDRKSTRLNSSHG